VVVVEIKIMLAGGGAGGYRTSTQNVNPGTTNYYVTVGDGGAGAN
jgi:hypothetical protein